MQHVLKSIVAGFACVSVVGCAGQEATPPEKAVATGAQAKVASPAPTPPPVAARIEPGPNAQKQAQTALIKAKPGETVEFGAGRFEFKSTLSLDVSGVTLRGQGHDKTILSFKDQGAGTGGEGLLITSKENVEIRDLAVEDAKGDAIKARGTKRIFFRKVRTEWTGGPKETNGGYGIYPVLCTDVLIEDCIARGASDSGIYVGQSENIIVRRSRAEQNVAGIEIENSTRADVYDNDLTDNTGGILVFALPDLERKSCQTCRVFKNRVISNNHENFAPKGNIVASVSPGTGMMIMAGDGVEVFDNTVEKNQTSGLFILSYLLTGRPIKDDKYDPYSEGVSVHDNRFVANGTKPAGPIGQMLGEAFGKAMPDILDDGIVDQKKFADGKLPADKRLILGKNDGATFATLGGSVTEPKLARDPEAFRGEFPALAAVSIEGLP